MGSLPRWGKAAIKPGLRACVRGARSLRHLGRALLTGFHTADCLLGLEYCSASLTPSL